MTDELIELCQKYKLKLSDTNKVYWFLANNQKNDAINYLKQLVGNDYQIATKIIELYQVSEQEQIQDGKQQIQNIIRQEFTIENKNIPKCPTCNSTNVQKIGTGERAVSIATLGIFSNKINKSFKCKNCGYTW